MLLGFTETRETQEDYALAVLEPLASEKPEKLEKSVLLGFRETKETRKVCALGLQRNRRNSKRLCSRVSEKPKKLEKALGALGLQTNKRNSKPQCSWAACLGDLASQNTERPKKQGLGCSWALDKQKKLETAVLLGCLLGCLGF